MLSQGITYGVSALHFWHIVTFCPFLMVSGLGHPWQKETFEEEVGENTRVQNANFFIYKQKQDEIDFFS
jgi:hypothetical protein